jgi:cytochrome c nitrite reductase small subunit
MKPLFLTLLFFIGLGIFLVPAGRFLENHPSFCNSCHEMNRPYEGWKSSGANRSHSNCMDCHSGKGVSGIVEAESRGLGQLVAHFLLSEKELKGPFIAHVPRTFCLKCHDIQLPRTAKAHLPFRVENKECSGCHKHQEGWEFSGEIRKQAEK